MKKEQSQPKKSNWLKILWIILIIWGIGIIISIIFELTMTDTTTSGSGNVAIIPIYGVITTEPGQGLFATESAASYEIIKLIDEAENNPQIKAIVFEINSPGGSPVATDEISQRIKKTQKPTVSIIREVGASGAYWISTSTDHIITNRMSIVGSIGVYGSYLEFSGLLNRYNVTYVRMVSGEYKDMGSPLKDLEDKERVVLQKQLDLLYSYFVQEVATNRNMTYDDVDKIADGLFYLGSQAKDLKLIDELGGRDEVTAHLNQTYNITAEYVYYEKKESFLDMIRGVAHHSKSSDLEIQRYINPETPVIRT